MAERGIIVGHFTLHRWVIRLVPLLDKAFHRHKRTVGRRWRMDEICIKVRGQWKYLYRAIETAGQTIDFLLIAKRDSAAALRFFSRPSVTEHRNIKRRIKLATGFKSCRRAHTLLAGIELIHIFAGMIEPC
ncbi:transposase-like protein [Yokenella regensburgei]|nr:transposase-like protein [Yokenella regensburgei]